MISSHDRSEKLPVDAIRDVEGVAHTLEVTASTLYEAVALELKQIRGNEGTVRHGDGEREKRAGGAHGEDGIVHKVDATKREESGGDDVDQKRARDFGDPGTQRRTLVRPRP